MGEGQRRMDSIDEEVAVLDIPEQCNRGDGSSLLGFVLQQLEEAL